MHDCHHTVDKGHGRLELRQSWTIADPDCTAYLNAKEAWPGLRSIGMVEAERRVGGSGQKGNDVREEEQETSERWKVT